MHARERKPTMIESELTHPEGQLGRLDPHSWNTNVPFASAGHVEGCDCAAAPATAVSASPNRSTFGGAIACAFLFRGVQCHIQADINSMDFEIGKPEIRCFVDFHGFPQFSNFWIFVDFCEV